jgi:hypothetical protein
VKDDDDDDKEGDNLLFRFYSENTLDSCPLHYCLIDSLVWTVSYRRLL